MSEPAPPPAPPQAPPLDIPAYDAFALTQGGNLAQLILHGEVYTLRVTRNGKLILTK